MPKLSIELRDEETGIKRSLQERKIMKRIQIIFGIALMYFAFTNQVLAVNKSVTVDETDEMIQAITAGIKKITDFSRQQKSIINSRIQELKLLQTKYEDVFSKLEKLRQETNRQIEAMDAKARLMEQAKDKKELQKMIQEIKDQMAKLEVEIKKLMDELKNLQKQEQMLEDAIKQNNDAENAVTALTAIAQDRSKAARFLEAIKTNNRTSLNELLKQNLSGVHAEVQEIRDRLAAALRFGSISIGVCISPLIPCNFVGSLSVK